MRFTSLLLVSFLAACSTSSSSPPADAGSGDASGEGGDGAPACNTGPCATAADCPGELGGLAGCWTCVAGCCSAVPNGTDPAGACVSACKTQMYDGIGHCAFAAVSTKPKGASCGNVCFTNPSGQTDVVSAECDGSGVCTQNAVTINVCSVTPLPLCTGYSNNCSNCPAGGCTAQCGDADAAAPLCP